MMTPHRPSTLALTALTALMIATAALAQVGTRSTNDPGALTPVDQGTADLGELNTSNRLIPVDLRQPNDFNRLYLAPDDSGRLMRVSGGLSAVFPRSEYAVGPGYVIPLIPAGTEFFIGPMPTPATDGGLGMGPVTGPTTAASLPEATLTDRLVDSRQDLATSSMSSNLIDSSAGAPLYQQVHASNHPGLTLDELLTGRKPEADPAPEAPVTIWTHERYRQGRLARLLQMARD